VVAHDLSLLSVVFTLNDVLVALKFFVKSLKAGLLELDQVIDVDEVVPERHLVLFLSLVQVSVEHLEDGVLGVDFSVMVLLINLNFLLQLFGLGQAQHLTPVGQDLHPVEMS
jgi:hypothetical protein